MMSTKEKTYEEKEQENLEVILKSLYSHIRLGDWELRKSFIRGKKVITLGFITDETEEFVPLAVLMNEALYDDLLHTDNEGNRVYP